MINKLVTRPNFKIKFKYTVYSSLKADYLLFLFLSAIYELETRFLTA